MYINTKWTRLASRIESRRSAPSTAGMEPATAEELFRRIVFDRLWMIETLGNIRDISGRGVVPFIANSVQLRKYIEVWKKVRRYVELKGRKYGGTMFIVALEWGETVTRVGHVFRGFLHKDKAAKDVKETIGLLHEGAIERIASYGLNPYDFLPKSRYDNVREYSFSTQSKIVIETAKGDAVGHSDQAHSLYLGEYSKWGEEAEKRRAQIEGSMPLGFDGRVHIDFNADGLANDAAKLYKASKEGKTKYTAVFFPVQDHPDVWPPEEVEAAHANDRYGKAKYPTDDEHCWILGSKLAIFKREWIDECEGAEYFFDAVDDPAQYTYAHGVDTAEGVPDGDYACISGFELVTGREAYPPWRERRTPRETAYKIRDIAGIYPGIFVVESNNHGHAVLDAARNLEIEAGPFAGEPLERMLYFHPVPGKAHREWKIGFPTTPKEKPLLESWMEELLKAKALSLVSSNGREEGRIYSLLANGSHGAPAGFHDDEWMSKMLAAWGLKEAAHFASTREAHVDDVVVGRSMMQDIS